MSVGGGVLPEWRPDGRELYYVGPDSALMAVGVETVAGSVRIGRPARLFQSPLIPESNRHEYQPSAKGDRFLVNAPRPVETDPPVTVLLNWPAVVAK